LAVKEFEDIQITNPENVEVQNILSNLKANKDPFADVKPPLDDKPESRDELPIKSQ